MFASTAAVCKSIAEGINNYFEHEFFYANTIIILKRIQILTLDD
jgi:hypothetical protein